MHLHMNLLFIRTNKSSFVPNRVSSPPLLSSDTNSPSRTDSLDDGQAARPAALRCQGRQRLSKEGSSEACNLDLCSF